MRHCAVCNRRAWPGRRSHIGRVWWVLSLRGPWPYGKGVAYFCHRHDAEFTKAREGRALMNFDDEDDQRERWNPPGHEHHADVRSDHGHYEGGEPFPHDHGREPCEHPIAGPVERTRG
jgi:hypothetical protein